MYVNELNKIKQIKIGDSFARNISGGLGTIHNVKDVIKYAEPACLEAMLYCYRNNILTSDNDTDCVKNDSEIVGECDITISYKDLIPENKKIIDDLLLSNQAKMKYNSETTQVIISVSCSKENTIGETSDKLLEIFKKFKYQCVFYDMLTKENIITLAINKKNRYVIKKNGKYKFIRRPLKKKLIDFYSTKEFYESSSFKFICDSFEEYKEYCLENEINQIKDANYEELCEKILINGTLIRGVSSKIINEMDFNEIKSYIYDCCYMDEVNGYIYNSKSDYLKHQKYIAMKEIEVNKGKEMINMENIRNYDEDIMLAIDNIDLFDDGTTEKLSKEWETIRNEVIAINEKYKDNEFFKQNALEKYKKIYLKKLLETDELNESDLYEYYTLILEFLGVNSYILESEMEKIKSGSRSK